MKDVSSLSRPYRCVFAACWLGAVAVTVSGCAANGRLYDETFAGRIDDYMQLRAEAVRAMGSVEQSAEPGELWEDIVELTRQIQLRRNGAREGDIFGAPMEDAVRSALRLRISRRDGDEIMAQILDVQPEPFSPTVNAHYPPDEPRTTMPTQVLRVLPPLPDELSYRFVGNDLVLLDRTGLILDVLRDALPDVDTRR